MQGIEIGQSASGSNAGEEDAPVLVREGYRKTTTYTGKAEFGFPRLIKRTFSEETTKERIREYGTPEERDNLPSESEREEKSEERIQFRTRPPSITYMEKTTKTKKRKSRDQSDKK